MEQYWNGFVELFCHRCMHQFHLKAESGNNAEVQDNQVFKEWRSRAFRLHTVMSWPTKHTMFLFSILATAQLHVSRSDIPWQGIYFRQLRAPPTQGYFHLPCKRRPHPFIIMTATTQKCCGNLAAQLIVIESNCRQLIRKIVISYGSKILHLYDQDFNSFVSFNECWEVKSVNPQTTDSCNGRLCLSPRNIILADQTEVIDIYGRKTVKAQTFPRLLAKLKSWRLLLEKWKVDVE